MSGELQAFPPLFQLCRVIVMEPIAPKAKSAMYRQSIGAVAWVGINLGAQYRLMNALMEKRKRSWPRPILLGFAVLATAAMLATCASQITKSYVGVPISSVMLD